MRAVKYRYKNKSYYSRFDENQAVLPTYHFGSDAQLIVWGGKYHESNKIPYGAVVDVDDLKLGLWDCYFPRYAAVSVGSFMFLDAHNGAHWFTVSKGFILLAIKLNINEYIRVYCVIQTSKLSTDGFHFWPKVVLEEEFKVISLRNSMNI